MRRYLLFATERYALAILRPLEAEIRKRGDEAAWFALGEAGRGLRPGESRLATVREVKAFEPRAVFVPGNWVPDVFPGAKVEVFHGFNVQKRSRRKGHFRIRGFFDLYCTQGPDTTEPFRLLAERHGYFRVVETGWPKLDPLFRAGRDPAPAAGRRPLVLYASTFSAGLSSTGALYDLIREESARGRWDWLVTFHPKMPREAVERYRALEGEHLSFADTDDVLPLLRRADVMLSDTSSIASEFLLLDKPVVTFRNRAPGPQLIDVTRPEQVVPALGRALGRPAALQAEIRRYAARIHPYRDGRSSQRVLAAADDLVDRGPRDLRRKPLNLLRRLRARHAVRYYRLR